MIKSNLVLSIEAYNMIKSRCFFISFLFRIVLSLNHFQLPQFMLSKVNVSFLTMFLALYCLSKLTIWLNHDAFLISILFRIVSILNHFSYFSSY